MIVITAFFQQSPAYALIIANKEIKSGYNTLYLMMEANQHT